VTLLVFLAAVAGIVWYLAKQGHLGTLGSSAAAKPSDLALAVSKLSPEEKQKTYDAQVAELQGRMTRAQDFLDAFPKPLTDLEALAQSLTTPQATFEYVRDQVALEPYPGIMKDATGTFLTHGGNALDRSLLLASLLKQQGVSAKIAQGKLSQTQSETLLRRIATSPTAIELILKSLPATLPSPALNDKQKQAVADVRRRGGQQGKVVQQAIEQSSQLIQSSLQKAGLLVGRDAAPDQLAILQDHYWVQATINDQTTDLDPSFADAQIGQKFTEATNTFEPDGLPDELVQRIRIRIVGEFLKGGRVTSKELVSKEMKATDLLEKNIRLIVEPGSLRGDADLYQASLVVGDDSPERKVFQIRPREGGEESSAGEAPSMGGQEEVSGGLLGGLSGDEQEKEPQKPKPQPKGKPTGEVLARLYVDFASKGPHMADAISRRVILDRLEGKEGAFRLQAGMEDDRSLRALLIQVWDGTISVGTPHLLRVFQTQLETMKAQESMEEKARGQLYLGQDFGADDLAGPLLPPELLKFTFASDLGQLALGHKGASPVQRYYERPRLLFLRHGFMVADWSKPDGARRYREGIDLINAPFRFVGGGAETRQLALETGITDTALERFFTNGRADFNAVPLFAAASDQKIPLQAVGPAQESALDSVTLPPAIKRVLADELAQGRTLVVPARLVALNQTQTLGWWSIDSSTGFALGKMELGGAQDMAETSKLEEKVRAIAEIFGRFYGGLLGCYMLSMADALVPPSGPYTVLDESALPYGGEHLPTLKGGGGLGECVIGVTCRAIKELSDEAMSSFELAKVDEKIIEKLRELIAEWTATALGGPEMGAACKEEM
jgi:hypothetical protein